MSDAASKMFDLADVVAKCEARESPYLEFLRVPQLSCGIYQLSAGDPDLQSTHDEDEVYFVLSGRARMMVAGEEKKIERGAIIYVPAESEHEFIDVEEDLSMLVFFGSGGPSGGELE